MRRQQCFWLFYYLQILNIGKQYIKFGQTKNKQKGQLKLICQIQINGQCLLDKYIEQQLLNNKKVQSLKFIIFYKLQFTTIILQAKQMQITNPSNCLKCPTCKIAFTEQLAHKQHYKSDFHRYNLKRSMVSLPPASLQQFSTKKVQVKNQTQTNFQCGQCSKTFASLQTLNQHAQSKKHNIRMVPEKKQRIQKDLRPKIYIKNEKRCLFCEKEHQTMDESLKHMTKQHGFFISQQEYCVDRAKFILYLQEKIQVGMMCIFCDNKGAKDFATGDAVRNHMVSKNHTFMNTQKGYQEYQNHYDFSALFLEKLQEQKKYATPLGINFQKVKVIVNDQKTANQLKLKQQIANQGEKADQEDWSDAQDGDQQWEDESSQQGKIQEMQNEQDKNNEQIKQKRRQIKVRGYNIMVPTLTSTDELLLPNGKMLGHRKYRHIYKQAVNLNNWFENNKSKMLNNSVHEQALVLRSNLLQLMKRECKMKTIMRTEHKKYVKSGIQNSNLFRHFRSSNPL